MMATKPPMARPMTAFGPIDEEDDVLAMGGWVAEILAAPVCENAVVVEASVIVADVVMAYLGEARDVDHPSVESSVEVVCLVLVDDAVELRLVRRDSEDESESDILGHDDS
jgi:hypothetical protein